MNNKMLSMTLVVVIAFAFFAMPAFVAAQGKFFGNTDDRGTLTAQPPSVNVDPKLLGTWTTNTRYDWYDDSYSPNWERGTYHTFQGYKFNSDGTFYYHLTASGLTAVFKGTLLWRGNYSVNENKIMISSIEIQRIQHDMPPGDWETVPAGSFGGYANIASLVYEFRFYGERESLRITCVDSDGRTVGNERGYDRVSASTENTR